MRKIILASQSPRRRQLLQWAEVPFEVFVANTEELIPPGMALEAIPIAIAREKALAIKGRLATPRETHDISSAAFPILAADTVVVVDEDILGKPANAAEAIAMLTRLSGRTHRVITGVVILHQGQEVAFSETTTVCFHPLTTKQVEYYVHQYKPFDKAGAYAIQEWIGVVGIAWIQGDFYNVMGLPVSRVVKALAEL
jgi:septum formation protein